MATTTTNLQLIMPGGTDKIRIAQINSNMETIDQAIGAVGNTSLQQQITNTNTALTATQDGLAIVATGNTHAAITAGQFVYVKSHGTLSDGLYVASSNIAANGTLSSSNLTADTNGGLNALSDQIAKHTGAGTITYTNVTNQGCSYAYRAGVCVLSIYVVASQAISGYGEIMALPNEIKPSVQQYICFAGSDEKAYRAYITTAGKINVIEAVPNGIGLTSQAMIIMT